MSARLFIGVLLAVLIAVPACEAESSHPRLLLSAEDVALISRASPLPSGFDKALRQAKRDADRYLETLPDVPVPKDAGGGYTHEQHKRNSVTIQNAGFLYQITGNKAYVNLARDTLMAYADMYPALGDHPQQKNQSPGKLFWQSLNEAVWLVTIIQGYDAIYDALSDAEKAEIEKNLLHPMVKFR